MISLKLFVILLSNQSWYVGLPSCIPNNNIGRKFASFPKWNSETFVYVTTAEASKPLSVWQSLKTTSETCKLNQNISNTYIYLHTHRKRFEILTKIQVNKKCIVTINTQQSRQFIRIIIIIKQNEQGDLRKKAYAVRCKATTPNTFNVEEGK